MGDRSSFSKYIFYLRFQIISYIILTFVCISCCSWIITSHNNPMDVEVEKQKCFTLIRIIVACQQIHFYLQKSIRQHLEKITCWKISTFTMFYWFLIFSLKIYALALYILQVLKISPIVTLVAHRWHINLLIIVTNIIVIV